MGHQDSAGLLVSLLLGLGLGARHAFEPDHLAALGALSSAHGTGLQRGARLGILWGLGHTLSLLGVGVGLALLSARMPESLASALELLVAVMLVVLGARSVSRALRSSGTAARAHSHGALGHVHAGAIDHVHVGRTVVSRPLLVGMMHGLAGSGALTALAIAQLPTAAGRFAFIGLFGLGSLLSMAAISGLWGWPLAHLARRPRAARWLTGATGLGSAMVGLGWGLEAIGRLFA